MAKSFQLEQKGDDAAVVSFAKGYKLIDEQHIQELGRLMFDYTDHKDTTKPRSLVLDCSNIEYLSSGALGKFITADKKLKCQKDTLIVYAPVGSDTHEKLKITRLDKVFNVKTDADAANVDELLEKLTVARGERAL